MKEINGKILLLTSFLGLCIVLPFAYFRNSKNDESLSRRISVLKEGIRNTDYDGLDTLTNGKGPAPSGQIFGGTCFFEIRDIDLFLTKKLQAVEETPQLFPPLDLSCKHDEEGVSLSWARNPKNEALIKNLAGNPLLSLRYKIYRWSTGENSRPEACATLPYNRYQHIDKGLSPVENLYFYSVLTLFEGTVGHQRTLIESERSEVISIQCNDRFGLRLIAGSAENVKMEVTVISKGLPRTHVFTVHEGEEIGGLRDATGLGSVDFRTSLKILAIRSRIEEREEPVLHPAFNSDGSRTLDPITQEPVFRERKEKRQYTIYSVDCEDDFSRRRTLE